MPYRAEWELAEELVGYGAAVVVLAPVSLRNHVLHLLRTAAMLDHAIGPKVIQNLTAGMQAVMERHGWNSLDEFRGIRRDRVVAHSKIRRPDGDAYRGGYEAEGYAGGDAALAVERPR